MLSVLGDESAHLGRIRLNLRRAQFVMLVLEAGLELRQVLFQREQGLLRR